MARGLRAAQIGQDRGRVTKMWFYQTNPIYFFDEILLVRGLIGMVYGERMRVFQLGSFSETNPISGVYFEGVKRGKRTKFGGIERVE